MKITTEELKQAYRNMSDEELLDLDRDDLTEVALKVHDEELKRRDLSLEAEVQEAAADEPVEILERFDSLERAGGALSILESVGIPASIENDTIRGMGFQLLVPPARLEDARHALKAPPTIDESDAIIVNARYEEGVFVPLQDVEIREGAAVEVHIAAADLLR